MKQVFKSFLTKAGIVFTIWLVVYYGFVYPDGRLNEWLTQSVLDNSVLVLDFIGYNADTRGHIILIDNETVVAVGDECNGLELIALFTSFFLCFPGPLKYKLLFIPIGSVSIYMMNITREVSLALNYRFFQSTFEFNHTYTYVLFVYMGVFLIWRYWLNNYSSIGKKVASN